MRILNLSLVATLVASLFLTGCNSGTAINDPGPKTEPSSTTGTEPKTTETDPTTNGPLQPKPASTADIAPELKTAGYAYYGLDNAKMQSFTGMGADQEAGQQTTYSGVIDGSPTFKIARTGALARIGNSELIVKKDGLYSISVAGQKLDKPSLEVPADLGPGKKWKSYSTFSLELEGAKKSVTQDIAFHAVKVEKVTTKLGSFDALKVVATGTLKVGEESGKSDFSIWFVKEVGLVKMITRYVKADGVEQKMTMEIASQK